jgi:hypothetical protein
MGSQLLDDATKKDDAQLLRDAVRNVERLSEAINSATTVLEQAATDITVHIEYDDRIARALESIADTLSRLERQ